MKNILYKNIGLFIGIFLSATILVSCVKDKLTTIARPTDLTSADVKSYADLFKVFWTVMDQRYAFFLENYERNGMDWNKVYTEYYPKFEALKTWGKKPGVNEDSINKDTEQAEKYFVEVIDPIIDRHFNVEITMPYKNNLKAYTFYGDMKNTMKPRKNFYTLKYMKDRVTGDIIEETDLLVGALSSNPDIYYFGLTDFMLSTTYALKLNDMYLTPYPGNNYMLTGAEIDASAALNAIQDADARDRVRNFTKDQLNKWTSFLNMGEIKTFNDHVSRFNTTETISEDFINVTQLLLDSLNKLAPYDDFNTYSSVITNETEAYLYWFMDRMNKYLEGTYELTYFLDGAEDVVAKGAFYKKFLNPLNKGDIKKIIIDLRGNGGGKAGDLSYFVSRFITKQTIFGYQRLKEGNGQFNYTPWAPMYTESHPFGVPSQIPIVVLTDFGSGSTSEIATLMLKSQGEHVVSIGDYTAGATAGLADFDKFNAGTRDKIANGYLKFYLPVLALKDQNEEIIEGVGIKPNIYVAPLTYEEVIDIRFAPTRFVDRALDEAINYLSR